MKAGVVSDTHFTDLVAGLSFLDGLCRGPFADVDVILHAGDIVHPDLLFCFETKPILGVRGNCDESAPELPMRRVEEIAGFRVGMTHGWGGPDGIIDQVCSEFEGIPLDILIFGHTHYPLCRQIGGLLLFNPGSATDRREAPYHSVGILDFGPSINSTIVNLDSSASVATGSTGDIL